MIKVLNFKIVEFNGVERSIAEEAMVFTAEQSPKYNLLKVSNNPIPDAISVKEFADAADITPQAVRKMISENRLKADMLGSQYVINKEELARYLQAK